MGRAWRVLGTGFCFLVYGGIAWLAGYTLLPLVNGLSRDHVRGQQRARVLVSLSFRALLTLIRGLGVGRVHIEGEQWLRQAAGCMVVANHPMYLDIVALVARLPHAICVMKAAMQRNRWYRRFAAATGYIANDDTRAFLDDCIAALRRKETLILFPQGTRTRTTEPVRLRRGAAQIAVRSGCPILPVVIRCEPLGLGAGQAWYDAPPRPWQLSVTIYPPRTLADWGSLAGQPDGIAARALTRALEDFFTRKLAIHECTD